MILIFLLDSYAILKKRNILKTHAVSSCNACPKILDMSAELASNKHSSSLVKSVSDEEKSFITSTPEELSADERWPEYSRARSSS
jgi:hypothetical protein